MVEYTHQPSHFTSRAQKFFDDVVVQLRLSRLLTPSISLFSFNTLFLRCTRGLDTVDGLVRWNTVFGGLLLFLINIYCWNNCLNVAKFEFSATKILQGSEFEH